MSNSIKRKTADERMKAIAKGLATSMVPNTSPNYQSQLMAQNTYASEEKYITVTLDKLRSYEHNPRRTPNPNFEMIKESIRRRGLDHAPNITQRPGEDFYIIADGGNTRLTALKELFTETQDPKFWSISCHYKPWGADSADDVEAELNLLIGHLIENDTRADLTFIEKALGIQQAREYYEKQEGNPVSARELAQHLEKDGYIIHHATVSKMERCLTFLYPHIPDVLFNGLGNAPIDKLLSIRNNAQAVWLNYRFDAEAEFESLWAKALGQHNHDEFKVKDFQFDLIEGMVDALGGETNFDALFLEIDLDEQRFRRMAAKQQNLANKVANTQTEAGSETEISAEPASQPHTIHTEPRTVSGHEMTETGHQSKSTPEPVSQHDNHDIDEMLAILDSDEDDDDFDASAESTDITPADIASHLTDMITQNFGLVPGKSVQQHREQTAKENGLEFACTGRQPVAEIWQVYPGRRHKAEAYSLALDIAQQFNLHHLVEHVVHEPADYSFHMKSSDESLSDEQQSIYDLLQLLQTEELNTEADVYLSHKLLMSEIEDITLVKIFRLIRVVRFIHQQAQGGEYA